VASAWFLKKRSGLLRGVFTSHAGASFNWGQEVLPLQWRVGLNWISVFLMSQLATPILFYYQNPEVAGQIGLSLTIANMLAIIAQSWIARRVPALSQAVAKREWDILDHLFKKDFRHSMIVFFVGALIIIAAHYWVSKTVYFSRVLSFWPFVGLLSFVLFTHINNALSSQLRSFKKEPLVWVSFTGALLILPGSIYAAKAYSVNGVIVVMLGVQALLVFPLSYLLWRKFNQQWRFAGSGI
jgi:O-antigen/teichoic acid export membrane protein